MEPLPVPIADCPTCRDTGMYLYDDLMDGGSPSPEAVALMGGEPPYGGSGVVTCRVCGTFYAYTYDCGFGEHDLSLRRIAPREADAATDLPRSTRELHHSHGDTREYAALCLAEEYLARGEPESVLELLRHPDPAVRTRVVVTVIYRAADVTPFLPALLDLLADPDPSVRANAVRVKDYHAGPLRERREWILGRLDAASVDNETVRELRAFLSGGDRS